LGAVGSPGLLPVIQRALAEETHPAVKRSLQTALADIAA
jgi:hypothetical protein